MTEVDVKAKLMFHFEGEKKLLEADCVLRAKNAEDKVGFARCMLDLEAELLDRHIKIEWEFDEDDNGNITTTDQSAAAGDV